MRSIFLLLCLPILAWGSVFYVHEGESIQQAVLSALDGDTVLIHDGVYQETTVLYGKLLTIGSEFLLDGDTAHIAATIIEPDLVRPDTGSCFVYAYYEPEGGRLVGMTMRYGMGTLWQGEYFSGGAVFIFRSRATVEDCRLTDCYADLGGGVCVEGQTNFLFGNGILRNVRFDNCDGHLGGGVYANRCSLRVENCVIRDGNTTASAGGITVTDGMAETLNTEIRNCTGLITGGVEYLGTTGFIRGCVFEGNGGGNDNTIADLNLSGGNVEVSGCIFRNNSPSGCSIVEFRTPSYPLRFIGNVIENNTTVSGLSGTFLLLNNSRGEIAYCIFRGNDNFVGGAIYGITGTRVRVHHCTFEANISRSSTSASAMIISENSPMVVDSNIFVGNSGMTVGHLHAYDTEPIHVENNYWGDPSGPYHPTLNPEGRGDTLLQDSILFIPWLTEPPDTTMPSNVRERTHSEIATTWRLIGVYPNPFNSTVRIILAGFARDDFRLTLHNLLGQEVAVIHAGALTGGELSFTAPPSLATGVYFLRAASRDLVETKKVLFMK